MDPAQVTQGLCALSLQLGSRIDTSFPQIQQMLTVR